jgi:hypothetical protein
MLMERKSLGEPDVIISMGPEFLKFQGVLRFARQAI